MRATKRILVIDDEAAVRERVVRMLSFEGYHTLHADNGRDGVELAWAELPDLVICDLLMPGINGFGVCRVLRDDPRSAHVPVMVLSAQGSQSDRERTHGLGAAVYLTKPFRAPTLMAAVRQCLGEGA